MSVGVHEVGRRKNGKREGASRYMRRSWGANLLQGDLQLMQDALEIPPLLGVALEADRVGPELELGNVR